MSLESPAFANQASTYGADQTRRAITNLLQRGSTVGSITGGVVAAGDCVLSAPVSGLSVNVAPGELWIPGQSSATQGGYYARVSSTTNLTIAGANPSNPRIDLCYAQAQDAAYAGSANAFVVAIATGTPTSGATLSNLSGAPSVPTSALALGYVLVSASATNIITADISNVAVPVRLGVPTLGYVAVPSTYTLKPGDLAVATAAGLTLTLPTPAKSAVCAVFNYAGTGASPTTVTTPSGGIYGVGANNVGSIPLGAEGAFAVFESDGTNWLIVAGQQDTGWITPTLLNSWTSTGFGYRILGRFSPTRHYCISL